MRSVGAAQTPHRSVAAARKPDGARRDPAPSRLAYKAHRLWLTPLFRGIMRVGLPVFFILLAAGWYFSNPTNRFAIGEKLAEIQKSVQERPEFMVKLMAVEGATPVVADAVRQLLPVSFPISSFDLDLEQMRQELSKLDVIENVDLRIRPGGVLEVAVTERQPVAIWRHDGILDLLDATGHRVASLTARDARADLPLLAGEGADQAVAEALRLLQTSRPLANKTLGLVRVSANRWDIALSTGQRIQLPAQNPNFALEQVIALDQAQDLLDRDITVIDMRSPDRPTLRMADTAVAAMHKIRELEFGEDAQ